MKFYIEDDLFEVHEVDEKEFMKALNQAKETWGDDCDIKTERDTANRTIMKTWCFEWVKMWVVANDCEEFGDLFQTPKQQLHFD